MTERNEKSAPSGEGAGVEDGEPGGVTPVWTAVDRLALGVGSEPVVYGRVCASCGHLELSEDELLFVSWRECPSCTVRPGQEHSGH